MSTHVFWRGSAETWTQSLLLPGLELDYIYPIYSSSVEGVTGMYHHSQIVGWGGVSLIFIWASL
jgi:hypothetical protein